MTLENDDGDTDDDPYGALFAGSHITSHLLDSVALEVNERLDTKFTYTCRFCAECDPETVKFIDTNFDVELIAEYSKELANDRVKDVRDNIYKVPRDIKALFFGFTCISRSSINPKASQNLGCIQDGKEKTGEAWNETKEVIKAKRPERLYGENLKTLEATTPDHMCTSDAEFIKGELRDLGYWVDDFIVKADVHGSFVVRTRWYLYSMLSPLK